MCGGGGNCTSNRKCRRSGGGHRGRRLNGYEHIIRLVKHVACLKGDGSAGIV